MRRCEEGVPALLTPSEADRIMADGGHSSWWPLHLYASLTLRPASMAMRSRLAPVLLGGLMAAACSAPPPHGSILR